MMRRPSALLLAIALHIALLAFVASGMLDKPKPVIESPKVIVQLLTPAPAAPEPAKPAQPTPEPPKPKPPKAELPKPAPPREEPARPEPAPKPAPAPASVPTPAPAAPEPVAPAPVAPAPPPPAPRQATRTEVSITASYAATNRKPEYPKMSQRLGEQGTVVLTVLVKSDGSAGDVEVKSSSGFPRLDRAAADAVKSWHFNPATLDGKPVDKTYDVPIPFKLMN
jgi:protein TonB